MIAIHATAHRGRIDAGATAGLRAYRKTRADAPLAPCGVSTIQRRAGAGYTTNARVGGAAIRTSKRRRRGVTQPMLFAVANGVAGVGVAAVATPIPVTVPSINGRTCASHLPETSTCAGRPIVVWDWIRAGAIFWTGAHQGVAEGRTTEASLRPISPATSNHEIHGASPTSDRRHKGSQGNQIVDAVSGCAGDNSSPATILVEPIGQCVQRRLPGCCLDHIVGIPYLHAYRTDLVWINNSKKVVEIEFGHQPQKG